MQNRIKALRAEKNMTQEELAKLSNISRTTLVSIERGQSTPDGKTIAKIVKALGVPANRIFFDLDVV